MILRTLALAAAAQGLRFHDEEATHALQAEKPAWADAVKDEASIRRRQRIADSPSLFVAAEARR